MLLRFSQMLYFFRLQKKDHAKARIYKPFHDMKEERKEALAMPPWGGGYTRFA